MIFLEQSLIFDLKLKALLILISNLRQNFFVLFLKYFQNTNYDNLYYPNLRHANIFALKRQYFFSTKLKLPALVNNEFNKKCKAFNVIFSHTKKIL